MKKGFLVVGFVLLFFSGCVSSINENKLNINIGTAQQTQILALKNSNNDINLYRLGSQIMEQSGFFAESSNPYGYYVVRLKENNDNAPNFFLVAWVNGITLFLPSLLGFPTDIQEFDITAQLFIFDSAGNMIKYYKNMDSFTKLSGLYYGQNPNGKASKLYSVLFKKILEQANSQSDEINYLLRKAGAITDDNMQAARSKITGFSFSSYN